MARTCVLYGSYKTAGEEERTTMDRVIRCDGTPGENAPVIIAGRGLLVVIADFRCLFISYWTDDDLSGDGITEPCPRGRARDNFRNAIDDAPARSHRLHAVHALFALLRVR